MTRPTSFAPLLERFFTQRLMQQRQASPHTISSYRDTFRQFLKFVQTRLQRYTRTLVPFLTRDEVDALLRAPDRHTWSGRRDHAFMLVAVQTGLRLSEMTGLKREDLVLGTAAHLRVVGKGRKERCTPVARPTRAVLTAWLRERQRGDGQSCSPAQRVNV